MDASVEAFLQEHKTRAMCERSALQHYIEGTSASNIRAAKFARYHHYVDPVDGDQWPEDDRPGKIHITINLIRAFIITEARVLSLLPRITNVPPSKDKESRRKGENVEELFLRFLELTDWGTWMADWNRVKSTYGIGILKPYWDTANKRPAITVIEQPQNLMIGYGDSDYKVMDWAIYKYFITPTEAKRRFPDIVIENPGTGKGLTVARGKGDHADPLNQKGALGRAATALSTASAAASRIVFGDTRTEYEDKQVEVWDYWSFDAEGVVYNAELLQRTVVAGPTAHPEMPTIPYLVTENEHEPGSPDGRSSVETLIDPQLGLNRVFSHYAQLVADNSGTAYQLTGDNADQVPEGLVPAEDEIIGAGAGNQILPIERNSNTYNMESLIKLYQQSMHLASGLPEIMFGNIPSADTSGRVMAIQIEAAANRLDMKRRREYNTLRDVLLFWGYMLQKVNPSVTVSRPAEAKEEGALEAPGLESFKVRVGTFIKGFDRWNIVAPEITPRDSIENAQNVIQLVNAKLIPLVEGMDRIGVENPEQMISMIEAERSNARLYPADVQTYATVIQLFAAIMAQQQEQAAMAAQQGAGAAAQGMAAEQAATPTLMPDQNQQSQAGMAPPPGAGVPGGGIGATLEPLIRQTPGGESQAMSQVKLNPTDF